MTMTGTTKNIKVRVNSANFSNTFGKDALSIVIAAANDLVTSDGVSNIPLPVTAAPFTVANLTYE